MSRQRTRHRAKQGAGRLLAAAIAQAMSGGMGRFLRGLGEPHHNGNKAAPRAIQIAIMDAADAKRSRKRARCHELHGTDGMADTYPWQPSRRKTA